MVKGVLTRPVPGTGAQAFTQRRCRGSCRHWCRAACALQSKREADTKIFVNALDLLEETWSLHPEERAVRATATQALHSIHAEKLAFWRRRNSGLRWIGTRILAFFILVRPGVDARTSSTAYITVARSRDDLAFLSR